MRGNVKTGERQGGPRRPRVQRRRLGSEGGVGAPRLLFAAGYLVAGVLMPSSGVAKTTHVWVKNLTEQVLRLGATRTSRRLSAGSWSQTRREVRPGARVKVLSFDRRGQPRRTTVEWTTTVTVGGTGITLRQKNYRRLAYTHLSQSVSGDRWYDDRNMHVRTFQTNVGRIGVHYRAIHAGLADDIEYSFAGPDRPLFVLPVQNRSLINEGGFSVGDLLLLDTKGLKGPFGVDHRPDWAIRCRSYDERGLIDGACYPGHSGTDFMLRGGFAQMDRGNNVIIAAAAGRVVEVTQGNYDRCRALSTGSILRPANPFSINCGGRPIRNNRIVLEHTVPGLGTYRSYYLHIKKDSAKVAVNQFAACGTPLAEIGSAGKSAAPHLHFGVRFKVAGDNTPWSQVPTIDPFKGKINPRGLWRSQGTGRIPGGTCPMMRARVLRPTATLAPCPRGYRRGALGRCERILRKTRCRRGETLVHGRCQSVRAPRRLRRKRSKVRTRRKR